MPNKLAQAQRAASLVLILLLGTGLYAQFDIGLADNGDFTRAMRVFTSGPVGFERNWPDPVTERSEWERRFFKFYIPLWRLDYPEPWSWRQGFVSSAYLLWYPGVILNQAVYSRSVLNLGVMSLPGRAILLAVFGLAILWITRTATSPGARLALTVTLGGPLCLMLASTYYVAYFNSFYFESASLVFALLFIAGLVFLMGRSTWPWAVRAAMMLLAALLVATSKSAYFYWPLLALLGAVLMGRLRHPHISIRWIGALIAAAVLLSLLALAITLPDEHYLARHNYHRVFLGVLELSHDVEGQLEALGMSDAIGCVGVSGWTREGKACMDLVKARLRPWTPVFVVIREPQILWRMLKASADHMQMERDVGKYREGDPRAGETRHIGMVLPRLWAELKAGLFPRGYPLLATLCAYCVIFALAVRRDGMEADLGLVGLVCTVGVWADMFVAFAGDGFSGLANHLFMSNVLFDIATIAVLNVMVCWVVSIVRQRRLERAAR